MRFNELFKNPAQPLNEGLMKWTEWRKDKYLDPFTDTIMSGEDQNITFMDNGAEVDGVIDGSAENAETARQFKTLLLQNAKPALLSQLRFDVTALDEDDNPTGKVQIKLQDILKDDKITGELKVNLGNIAELVLGCAVTAKYEKQKADIEYEDVISVAVRLAQGSGTVNSVAGKDSISFSASVPSADRKAFAAFVGEDPKGRTPDQFGIKPAVIKGIQTHIKSAVEYVNSSPRVLLAVDKVAADPGENEVAVLSDGGNAENQKTTKVDLKIAIDGTNINLLSIKAGKVGQFGQVSGYEFERLNEFFEQSVGMTLSARAKKKFLALDASAPDRKENIAYTRDINYHNGFTAAYDEMEKMLRQLAKGDQLDLLERVYKGLLHHATRNEAGVEMVILSPSAKKAFSELTFGPELREALNDYNLTVNRGSSEKMHLLQIYGTPKTAKVKAAMGGSKEMLVQYRSYLSGGGTTVRNIIEMGNLLKDLADWEQIEQRKAGKIAGSDLPVTAPTAPSTPAQEPLQAGPAAPPPMPSSTTSIAPATATVADTDTIPAENDDLARIRKNAGIVVESK
jgi:hypothetical protein